jgi:uncharacterized protein involved in type VI secretion and phage assembly
MSHQPGLIQGLVVGQVTDLEDPAKLGRVRVAYRLFDDGTLSQWARIASLMAGPDRGTFFRPEIDDEVLLGFEFGSPDRPFILGALWNQKEKPPNPGPEPEKNHWRVIRSRSGHILRFDDQPGEEKIELIDKEEKRRLVIDVKGKSIDLRTEAADDTLNIDASSGKVVINAARQIDIHAKQASAKFSGDNGNIDIEGMNVTVKANAKLSLQGKLVDIKSDGPLTANGAIIKLN